MDEVDYKHQLLTLLAVIHQDGGHYETMHGPVKATVDAMKLVLRERQERREKCIPTTGLDLDDEGKVRCYT